MTTTRGRPVRRAVKRAIDLACMAVVGPSAAMCALEARLSRGAEDVFAFWTQALALVPGWPGVSLRRAFYRLTLERCGDSFFVGFGAFFSHRAAIVEDEVYIGPYAIVGSSWLHRGCLLGSRASVVSGAALHVRGEEGRWLPSDLTRLRRIEIGEFAWIGEAAVVMADVGRSAMVAAGAVVSSAVPPSVVVAGNPARFVRALAVGIPEEARGVAAAVSLS
jgi:virginiamycin A acetyltransferase